MTSLNSCTQIKILFFVYYSSVTLAQKYQLVVFHFEKFKVYACQAVSEAGFGVILKDQKGPYPYYTVLSLW